MFNRVYSRAHGLFYSGGAVRVSGNLASEPLSFCYDRDQLFVAELGRFGRVAFREAGLPE